MTYDDPFEILQTPRKLHIFYEYDHWIRQIWLNEQLPENLEEVELTWMGTSVGKWDGDTLVVDTVRMRDESWFDGDGHARSTELRIVERFRRVKYDILEVESTFTDPQMFSKPWTQTMRYEFRPDWKILERVYCDDRFQKRIY
jgi:hypothetical protein